MGGLDGFLVLDELIHAYAASCGWGRWLCLRELAGYQLGGFDLPGAVSGPPAGQPRLIPRTVDTLREQAEGTTLET